MEKAQDRLDVLDRIAEREKRGEFDKDVEDDPPSRTIMPGEVDYMRKKLSSKIKTKYAYFVARRFLNKATKDGVIVVKDVIGAEKFAALKTGAVITCNHFNAMDSFAMQICYDASGHKKRKMYKVIREGNYTSFTGFYGLLMRNCYTLPLSSNVSTTKEFITAVKTLLAKGNFVLVYAEQSMWWNYRKPKPLKKSAFKFAVESSVPVLPVFITMEDGEKIGPDGFPIQEYTIHVGDPIYPDPALTNAQNVDKMCDDDFLWCKKIYEDFYGEPLSYSTDEDKLPDQIKRLVPRS